MNNPDKKLSPRDILDLVLARVEPFKRYSLLIFLVFVAATYGFILFRINTLSNAQPSSDDVTSQVQAAKVPHIDQTVVQQLQSLQDNSVSVHALFDEARSNPFQQ